jgi:integrase
MNARVRISGRVHWLGKCPDGKVTAEQQARAARLWHEHLSGITPAGDQTVEVVVAPQSVTQATVISQSSAAPATGAITVAQMGLRYLDFCQTYYRTPDGKVTSSVAGVEMALRALFPFADTPAATFGPRALKVVRDALVRDGRPRVTCNRVVKTIRRMFKWASSEELVSAEAWHSLETVAALQKGRTAAPEVAPVEEVPEAVVAETLPHLPPVVAAMVWFQRWTGARPGEVCLLRPCDIDRSGEVWVYRPQHHKLSWREDAMPRQIAIGSEGQKVLMPFLLRAASAYCFSPADAQRQQLQARREERKTPLYKSHVAHMKQKRKGKSGQRRPGDRYTTASYRRAIARAVEAANDARDEQGIAERLPNWSPNQLRHLRAGEVEEQFGIEAANAVLGHSNIRTTEIYARRKLQIATEVTRQIG